MFVVWVELYTVHISAAIMLYNYADARIKITFLYEHLIRIFGEFKMNSNEAIEHSNKIRYRSCVWEHISWF